MRLTVDDVTGQRVIPVVTVSDLDLAVGVGRALLSGGLTTAEVTLRSPQALEVLGAMSRAGDVIVGAGTVIRPEQVDTALAAGAQFVVSPGICEVIVRRCAEVGLPIIPGVSTATEAMQALGLGLSTVKYFPAKLGGGPAGVQAMSEVFPDLRFVPTGGIGQESLAAYLSIPSVVAVGGTWLIPRDLDSESMSEVTVRARDALATADHT